MRLAGLIATLVALAVSERCGELTARTRARFIDGTFCVLADPAPQPGTFWMMFCVRALHAAALRIELFEQGRRHGLRRLAWIRLSPIELDAKVRTTGSARNAWIGRAHCLIARCSSFTCEATAPTPMITPRINIVRQRFQSASKPMIGLMTTIANVRR